MTEYKRCVICSDIIDSYRSTQKVCYKFDCYRKNKTIVARERKIRLGQLSGLPQGESQLREKSVLYRNGISEFRRQIKVIKTSRRYCEICNKDLLEATQYFWAIHHIDFNRDNNPIDGSNWQLVCKGCHNNLHSRGKKEYRELHK